ncbi:MAG: translation initiation factor IF-2 [Vicinamibacterales bacterium]
MSTVRIYKVAELLATSSQEVLALLKQNHGIELKSASSTLEEIVARQFVDRLARQRGIELPKGDIFSEAAAKAVKKSGGPTSKKAAPEPPKPAAPSLPPPRLIKTMRPPVVPVAASPVEGAEAGEAEMVLPELEPVFEQPGMNAAVIDETDTVVPPSTHGPAAIEEPPAAVQAASEETISADSQLELEVPTAPPAVAARPAPSPGRFVPPSIRLRIEEPGKAPPSAPPLQPRRPIQPPQPRGVPPPSRPAGPPSVAARGPTPGGPRPSYSPSSRPGAGTTPAMIGGPRPLPSAPVRPAMPPGRPGMPARPGAPMPSRPGMPGRPPFQQRPPSHRPQHRRDGPSARPVAPAAPAAPPPVTRTITLAEGMTVKDLSDKLDIRVKDVLKVLLDRRMMMTINSTIDIDTARDVARNFGAEVETRSFEQELTQVEAEAVNPADLVPRAPVVTVMGHVDHGKTTLLDAIREAKVAEREAGGITQHIGAYHVTGVGEKRDKSIVFLDTPGHEAFTLMRARGAKVTDVVILVVAADDGVMPQTREAVDHAKAAGVPLIVAVNKIDKAGANPEVVKRQLADLNLVPEEWGGQTVFVEVSAKKRQNLDLLLEMILLVTDIGEHKANPKRAALGTVLETKLDRGRGPVATVLVQDGTLSVGDNMIAGPVVGRVRAIIDDRGRSQKHVGPSNPVEVLGLEHLPSPGDQFQVVADPAKARQIATFRQAQAKEKVLGAKGGRLTLEAIQQQMAAGGVKDLPIIIKADVQGSAEVLAASLQKLSDDKTNVKIIHSAVGAINESDVLLATASNAIIIGFNVRPDRNAEAVAEREKVEIRLHSVIYNVTEEIQKAMAGLLEPTFKEVRIGTAAVREAFKVPKVGTIAGCIVQDGRITRQGDAQARLLRDNVVVWQGKLASLKRFKDDVSEVKSGFECGIGLQNFNDVKTGDVIEVFQMERVAVTA